jgi:hypothetical protein
MQPYRTVKPHSPAECPQCSPTGTGHQLCQGCDEIATSQTLRHATDAEYAALPEGLRPIDGLAQQTVYACDDCAEAPTFQGFCVHPEPAAVPCPKCKAAGDEPCTAKSGDPRYAPHTVRALAQPTRETCTHAHRPDCEIFTDCQCTGDDQAPARPPRTLMHAAQVDVSGLTIPVPAAQMILAQAGTPWVTVVRAWNLRTQDDRPALAAEVQVYESGHLQYDAHGHAVTTTIIVPMPDPLARQALT